MTIEDLLETRASRGEPRGSATTFEHAVTEAEARNHPHHRSEPSSRAGRPLLWAAAAALLLTAGFAVWTSADGDGTDLTLVEVDPARPGQENPGRPGQENPGRPGREDPGRPGRPTSTDVPSSAAPTTESPAAESPTAESPTATSAPQPPPTPTQPPPTTSGIAADCLLPAGAIAGQPADVNCRTLAEAPDTAQAGNNQWLDDFDHGASFADFANTSYQIDEVGMGEWWNGSVFEAQTWRHANHWMVDVQTGGQGHTGGVFVRPNQSFSFNNGVLVVEADAVAGHPDYLPAAWPELVITTADAVTGNRRDALYGYDRFPGHYTFGCRLQADSNTICSLFDDSDGSQRGQGRLWEMSWFQQVGSQSIGGNNFVDQAEYYRQCGAGDPDTECRDRFRLELTEDSVTIYVNGFLYFQQTGVPALPTELTDGDVFVYFASMVASQPEGTTRFHWDRLAVNPDSGPTASPTWP